VQPFRPWPDRCDRCFTAERVGVLHPAGCGSRMATNWLKRATRHIHRSGRRDGRRRWPRVFFVGAKHDSS
jgi:hypothetical protein